MTKRLTAAVLFTALALVLVLVPTGAGAAKWKQIDGYCSPTGDYCTAIDRKGKGQGKQLRFKFGSFAHRNLTLFCVKPKRGKKVCQGKDLKDKGSGIYEARIRFSNKKFPGKGRGKRKLTIHNNGAKLGPALKFRP